ncbi:zinc finger, CCHC-type containing protein [Tanacetum coccineum]
MGDAEKTTALKTNVYKKAHSALLLCLDNKVLREVNKEDSATEVWLKLETLYMTKSLANKFYLKKKLFTFHMHSGKKLSKHIDEFNKLIDYLANIDVDIDDKDQALMLLTSLPSSYDNFVETLLYGKESLTLEDVLSTLNSRELKNKTNAKGDGDGLYVRGRSDHWGNQRCGSPRSKSKGKGAYKLKCYKCYYEDHLKKDCPKRNKKKSTGFVKKNAGQDFGMHSEGYDNGDLLMAVNEEMFLEWIIDSGGSYHMTPRRDFLFNFKEFNGGTMKENYVYSLDGWAESGEASVGIQEKESLAQEFNNLCKESRIVRHLTLAGTPQQNGLAEQMNRMLLNKVRCLLIKSGLPDLFWAEAMVTTAYLINRSPSTGLENKTPMDLWPGHSANYEMSRIFGCVAYSRMNQGKHKPRAIKYIFLGYPGGVKGYRLWRKEVKFEVELQDSRVKPTMDPHTMENPRNEYEEQDKGPQQQNLDNYVLVRFREHDDIAAYAFTIAEEEDTHEPIIFEEAINSSEKDEWVLAMKEEMISLKKNHTWELVDQPPGQKLVSCKWLYKIKEGIEGIQKPKYKARLAMTLNNVYYRAIDERWRKERVLERKRRSSRKSTESEEYARAGIDYNEVFSLMVRHTSIRVILSLTACEDYELEQLDVKMAFLHGNLEETIYMRQPPGFEKETGNKSEIEYTKGLLRKKFNMKELGLARKILSMEIVRDMGSRTLKVSQSGYVQKILNNYRMVNGKSISVPLGAHFKVSLKDCPSSD